MSRTLITALAVVLAATLAAGAPTKKATLKPAAAKAARSVGDAGDNAFANYDGHAEQQLLDLANQARAQAGAAPLQMDGGLTAAARTHAVAMVQQHQLSHQFSGEPDLMQRLAATSDVHMDQAGENVALDLDVQQATENLLQSPPHRENLLNPAFNVAGFAVVRDSGKLYIVQDFGHSLPTYSSDQTENLVAATVNNFRVQQRLGGLQLARDSDLQTVACSMAQQDRLTTAAAHQLAQRYHVVTYTSSRPETMPDGAAAIIADRHLSSFSVGACYGRTAHYPSGVYWVVLVLY